ncbi:transglycosylase domain-containing protein [Fusobacterium sp.]|uniref:transglycosylase domain-containing protein n=1 Tax=Fusobacterium sp. TaxID=68766 RepID=UPI002905065F|nr:transglycosylase domain-containing protein [Fusobacterium sp.]MDU1912137.1 transglycosylase domain-containing protein [Fusobacterium sp.]
MKILVKRIIKIMVVLFIVGSIASVGVVLGVMNKYSKELPDIVTLIEDYAPSLPTVLYDRNREVIDTIYRESRDTVKLKEVPIYSRNAFLAIEDKQFYSHHGIHIKRLIGAIVANIRSGRAVQGASSITQQLAKNAFLSHERKLSRKIKEAIITFEIERRYTKDEIFEKYLNEIYFGAGSYGIKTAAKQLYRKDISEINIAESALLAGIPNRPEKYNPRRNLEASLKRANLILSEMYRDKLITKEEYEKAKNHKFINEDKLPEDFKMDDNTTIIYNKKSDVTINYPDFSNMVEEFLVEKFGENMVYTGGLRVHTTLDLEMQKTAKEVFENYEFFQKNDELQGGMATIDPNNGHVISLIGGRNFKSGNFNRATMAKRQLGSSFKPFLYFTAIENGMEMNSVVEDSFISFGSWIPKNYGSRYSNNVTLLNALDRSLNIVSIKMLQKIGTKTFKETVAKLDPGLNIPDDLTASLGSFENTPLQHAIDYSIFSNGGYVVEPVTVTDVEDRYGNPIYQNTPKKEKVFDSINTSIITFMLKSSVQYGSSSRASVYTKDKKRIEQGGKTGTVNDNRTIWFAGITPDYVTTIYIGYDDNRSIRGNVTGGTGVAPLWAKYYQTLIDKGLYAPSTFSFLENHLKNGDFNLQTLTVNNGLISGAGREFLVRKGKLQMESEMKYANGIAGIFGDIKRETGAEGYNPVIEKTNNDIAPENTTTNDSLFKRLLGN